MDLIGYNTATLTQELDWFKLLVEARMKQYFGGEDEEENGESGTEDIFSIPAPDLANDPSVFADMCRHYGFGLIERAVLMLALAPHIQPQALDIFLLRNQATDRPFSEFGGLKGRNHGGYLPTGETAAFLVAMHDLELRIRLQQMFGPEHAFARFGLLSLEPVPDGEPQLSGALRLGQDFLELCLFGEAAKPNYSSNFPARLINTSLEWSDLILPAAVNEQVQVVRTWVEKNRLIMSAWASGRKLKPGYRALVYGPPGTGKTLTASLIGKSSGKDVYLIDASMVVSKWVGETEKNLARVFDMAEHKDWILFFDEADALFGKRSNTSSSQEQYANQQVSYLLQRTENYPGTVILATNLKANIDEAFVRRFQSIIYFPMPTPPERQLLWEKTFAGGLPLASDINFKEIAKSHEITGGAIVNVLKYCAIMAAKRDSPEVLLEDLVEGIRKEMLKDGR
jgi:hypothetical protein